jgi:uncharacterized protein YegP (UPF0339 family)
MKIRVYRAIDGWRWRAEAANGEVVSESGEAYENKSWAIQSAKKFGPTNAVIFTDDWLPVSEEGSSALRQLIVITMAEKLNPNGELVIDDAPVG